MWAVHVVLEEDALFFALLCVSCSLHNFFHLLHDLLCPPGNLNKVMIVNLSVQQGVRHSRITGSHNVVQNYCCQDKMLCILWSLVHGHQETSEAVGEDAECVLNNAPCPRQTIIEDPLNVCHVVAGVWLHHPLGYEVVGQGSHSPADP